MINNLTNITYLQCHQLTAKPYQDINKHTNAYTQTVQVILYACIDSV